MDEESYIGRFAKVTEIERLSLADRSGLIVGDVILRLGDRDPVDAIGESDLLMSLGNKEWITILRDKVIFKLLFGHGLMGLTLAETELLDPVKVRPDARWKSYLSAVRPGESLLILPEVPAAHWWLIPLLAYGYYRLWQMAGATVFLYGIGAAIGFLPFCLTYGISIFTFVAGGSSALKDAAHKDGYLPRAKIALASPDDIPELELVSRAMLRNHAKEEEMARARRRAQQY